MFRHLVRIVGITSILALALMGGAAGHPVSASTPRSAEGDSVVVLTVDPGPWSTEGEAVTMAVTVTWPRGGGVVPASGSVQFFASSRAGSILLGTVTLDGAGTARVVTTALGAGRHILGVRYAGVPGEARAQTRSVAHDVVAVAVCPGPVTGRTAAVVRLVYMTLLGRCPDRAGLDHWVGRLDGGTSREAFAATIARTPEAVGKVVDDAYRTLLDRPADPAGRTFWVRRLQAHGRYDQLLADLGASPELWTRSGGTDDGFVTRIYERLLDRAPDARGMAYWLDRYADGASRRVLVRAVATLDEPLGRLVTLAHYTLLDRAPTAEEAAAGIAFLRRTGDRSGLLAQLIGRPEFAARA